MRRNRKPPLQGSRAVDNVHDGLRKCHDPAKPARGRRPPAQPCRLPFADPGKQRQRTGPRRCRNARGHRNRCRRRRDHRLGEARPGLRPGPHQGALPLGTPPRASPWNPSLGVGDGEGACGHGEGAPSGVPDGAPSPCPHAPSPSPTPTDGVQRLRLWWGSRGQSPLAGSGAEPRPCFDQMTTPPPTAPVAVTAGVAASSRHDLPSRRSAPERSRAA